MHRGQGRKKMTPPLRTGRGMGLWLSTAKRGIRCEDNGDRYSEERTPVQDNPGSDKDLGTG